MALQSLYPAIAGQTGKLPYLAAFGFSIWFIYCTGLWIYNVYFHPLRKFPGPMLEAATPLMHNIHYMFGNTHGHTEKLHAKYGEVVRLGPNMLSFINEQAWRDIYMRRQDADGKSLQLQKLHRPLLPNGAYSILNAPDDVHARLRRALSHAFSEKALREQESILRSYVDLVVRNLKDDVRTNRPVDMVKTFNFLTFDIVSDLTFAESFGATETRQGHPWFRLFWTTIKRGIIFETAISLPFAPLLLIPFAPFLLRDAKRLFAYSRQKVQARIATGDKERPDFMARLLKHNTDDGNGITVPEIEATFEVLMMAGSETTATLMSGFMWFVHRNPEVLAKLQKEIRGSFASDEEITLIKTDQLTYLHATIQETFRLYPPVPIALPRIAPPEGISICGEWVPGNTMVAVPQRTASLSPSNFTEPLSFVPERYITEGRPAKFENDQRSASQPFSAGPRNCVGKNLAYAELKLTLSRLIYNFNFEIVDTKGDWFEQQIWGLYDKKPLMMKVRDRHAKE